MTEKNKTEEPKRNIYWNACSKYELANFVKEKKEHGQIIVLEQSICFINGRCVLDPKDKEDKKKIKFIEASKAFKKKEIIPCENMVEAYKLDQQRALRKSQTQVSLDSDLDAQPAVETIGSGNL